MSMTALRISTPHSGRVVSLHDVHLYLKLSRSELPIQYSLSRLHSTSTNKESARRDICGFERTASTCNTTHNTTTQVPSSTTEIRHRSYNTWSADVCSTVVQAGRFTPRPQEAPPQHTPPRPRTRSLPGTAGTRRPDRSCCSLPQ